MWCSLGYRLTKDWKVEDASCLPCTDDDRWTISTALYILFPWAVIIVLMARLFPLKLSVDLKVIPSGAYRQGLLCMVGGCFVFFCRLEAKLLQFEFLNYISKKISYTHYSYRPVYYKSFISIFQIRPNCLPQAWLFVLFDMF